MTDGLARPPIMQWPLERTWDGRIIEVRIDLSGPISKVGFERLRAYIAIWEEAWCPNEAQLAALTRDATAGQPVEGEGVDGDMAKNRMSQPSTMPVETSPQGQEPTQG